MLWIGANIVVFSSLTAATDQFNIVGGIVVLMLPAISSAKVIVQL